MGENTEGDGRGLTRRTLVRGALGGAAVAAVGAGVLAPAAQGAPLIRRSEIWDARTLYEIGGQYTSFPYDAAFYGRLESWLQFWYENTGPSVLRPLSVGSYGAWTSDGQVPGHGNGRALDVSRIMARNADGAQWRAFDARYDLWSQRPASEQAGIRRRYWATVASACYWFRDVLHYAYDGAHHNHIHVDNTVSGSGYPAFSTGSRAQTSHVQACCRHIWELGTGVDGIWGPQTEAHTTRVLRATGTATGTIRTSSSHWRAFNRVSLRQGYGKEQYPQP